MKINTILAALTTFLCAGCWVPESFTGALNVDKNLNYTFRYEGILTYALAQAAITQQGQLSAKDEADLKKAEADLRKEAGMKKVEYQGKGRFKISFEQSGKVQGAKKLFLDLLVFKATNDGNIAVQGVAYSKKDRKELEAIKLGVDGTLKITTDLTVLRHNATSEPKLGGLFGAYEWHVTLATGTPFIILKKP
jgi:hypothetical protein